MRIGIIGAGELGAGLAELWTISGHQLAVADTSDATLADALAERTGPSVQAMTAEDAARFGDVVVLTGSLMPRESLPSASALAGKVVVDAMNALTESGEPIDLGGRHSSELVGEWFPDAAIVKAFNAIEPDTLRTETRTSVPRDQRIVIFLAGDNVRANARVSTLIEELGFAPLDTGSLAYGGRMLQPGSEVFHRRLLPADARRVVAMMR